MIRQVLDAPLGERVEQMHGVAGHAKAAGHEHSAVGHQRRGLFKGKLGNGLH